MRKRVPSTIASLLAICVLVLFAGRSMAAELIVDNSSASCSASTTPPCYRTIPEAIIAANTGDLITVEPGTYAESITLRSDINITITGVETARTVLTGGGSGTIVTANNVVSTTLKDLTFTNALIGIQIQGTSSLTIAGNVFSVGKSGTAVAITSPSSPTTTTVLNNTFLNNGTAIQSNADLTITNDIFSGNTLALSSQSPISTFTLVTYCCFHNNTNNGITVDAASTTSTNIPNSTYPLPADPLFVNPVSSPPALDLHLKAGSPAINTGSAPNSIDPAKSDRGAYGGGTSDTVPFQVAGFSSSATTTTSVSLSWTGSLDHAVSGYKVYYDTASHLTSGKYIGTGAAEGPSPIDAGSATTFVVSGLTSSVTTPAYPDLNQPIPRNGALLLSWSAVPGATSYNVYYHLVSSTTTTEFVIPGIPSTSFTLTGLLNDNTYAVQVTAVSQATYYFAVTAYYQAGGTPGSNMESAYSTEIPVAVGPAMESFRSGEVQGYPEATLPYPYLPNSGCFIATAAYDSPDAGPVMILRVFRDRYLLGNAPGQAFINWYYHNSPDWARTLNQHPAFKPLVRLLLTPIVALAFLFNVLSPVFASALMILLAAAAMFVFRRLTKAGARTPRSER